MSRITRRASLVLLATLAPALATAQSLGTFQWQLQPFCNVVTLTVTQEGSAYRLTGTDDLCGRAPAASAVGTAFANADGSIGFGLTIVASPSGTPVHVGASIALSTLNGSWHDSAGHSGTFVATRGAASSGNPRPTVPAGLSGVTIGYGLRRTETTEGTRVTLDVDAVRQQLDVYDRGGIGVGERALAAATADAYSNTAIGDGALATTTIGDFNTAAGDRALASNLAGGSNAALGAFALNRNVDASDNTAVGTSALERSTIGDGNTAVGSGALFRLELGRNNIGIGQQAGFNLVAGSYNVYLGSPGVNLDNYTVRIGYNNSGSRAFIHGIRGRTTGIANAVPVVVDSDGQLGTVSSSRRFKEEISDLGDAGQALQFLRPVSFRYSQPFADGSKPVQYGLIAEEVQEVMPALVAEGTDGQPETVMYHVLPTLLVAEVQRLERERAALASRVEALEQALRALTTPAP